MGSWWPKSGDVVFDNNGAVAPGAKIYFYDGGTSTPRTTYTTAALGPEHDWPIEANGDGRIPPVFLDYGEYRFVIKTSAGTQLTESDEIPNDEPPTIDDVDDPDSRLTTGDVWFSFKNSTRSGAVRCNGRTIGSASSGATERANADCEDLFIFHWDSFSDSICDVGGGRGATAALDWAANKQIRLHDLRGRTPAGLDDMGNSAASRIPASVAFAVGNATTGGSICGANELALAETQIPAHTHGFGTLATGGGSAHTHGTGTFATASGGGHTPTGTNSTSAISGGTTANIPVLTTGAGGGGNRVLSDTGTGVNATFGVTGTAAAQTFTGDAVSGHTHSFTGALATESSHTHSVTSGATGSTGSGAAIGNMQATTLGTWFIKL